MVLTKFNKVLLVLFQYEMTILLNKNRINVHILSYYLARITLTSQSSKSPSK